MSECRLGRDIPTSSRVRRLGIDDDEALRVGESLVRAVVVVSLGSAGAVVNSDDNGRVRGNFVGDVDVHLDAAGVGAEVGDLLQRSSAGGAGQAEEGKNVAELHG